MPIHRRALFPALLILTLLLVGGVQPGQAQGDSHYFPETKHTVSCLFWQYWQSHGGLAQQGYPISEEMQEKSDLNGQTYMVQYFERAVFEKHPENQAPYNVLLSQLGTFRYKAKYGEAGVPNQQVDSSNGRYFPETKHTLGGKFRTYWEQHGGLAQQGYPISDEFTEKSDLNGQSYTVQYFERAVFELHPENQPPYDVLLSQSGTFQYRAKYQGANPTPAPPGPSPTAIPPAPTPTQAGTNCAPVADARKAPIAHTGPIAITTIQPTNPEYVALANTGGASVDLSNWVLRDKNETSQHYTFPAGTTLAAGASIQIYTEPGHPYTFGRGDSIWNDCGDAAELLDNHGTQVATYAYGTHLLGP